MQSIYLKQVIFLIAIENLFHLLLVSIIQTIDFSFKTNRDRCLRYYDIFFSIQKLLGEIMEILMGVTSLK